MMVPVLLPALGETINELAGVFNIGIEGMMLIGGVTCYFVTLVTGNILIGVLAALLVGAITGLVTAYFEVTQGVDQVVFGLGMFLLGLSLSSFLHYTYSRRITTELVEYVNIPIIRPIYIPSLSELPYIGFLFNQNVLVYISIALVGVTWFILDKTWLGLKVRAIGQDAAVADSLGVPVFKYRYACLIVSGVLAALGGSYLIIALTGIWYDNISAGRGFIAFALLRLGSWKPWRIALLSFVYAGLTAIQYTLQVVAPEIPSQLFQVIPYVTTIIFLVAAKLWIREHQPRSLGIPYKRQ